MWSKTRFILVLLIVSLLMCAGAPSAIARPPGAITEDALYPVFLEVLSILREYHINEHKISDLLRGAIKGAVEATGDPYTSYMPKKDAERFLESIHQNAYGGIGVHIEQIDGFVTVIAPMPGTPAEIAGLVAGDRILEANGKNLRGLSLDIAASLIRGEPGTPVVLKIAKSATGEEIVIVIIRERIIQRSVEAELICNGAVGYVKISNFSDDVGQQVKFVVSILKERGARALVVDMRNNPGGLLDSAVEVSNVLVPEGAILHIVDYDGKRTSINGGAKELLFSPVIYLVNGGTASAAEIVVAAAQDTGTGHVVGSATFGKGTIQEIVQLANGDALKLTFAKYLTRSGRTIHGTGVKPDTEIPEERPEGEQGSVYVLRKPMNMMDKGDNVVMLQKALTLLGHTVKASGLFDKETAQAVKEYQVANRLSPTEIADVPTISALNKALRARGLGGFDYQLWKTLEVVKLKTRVDW